MHGPPIVPKRTPTSPVTQRDVARRLNVSHSTVSLSLRNSPKIPAARREQIRKAAEEMGYLPNPAAAALSHCRRSSSTPSVQAGIAWLNFWDKPEALHRLKEFDAYWRGAQSAAKQLGYSLEEFTHDAGSTSPERIESILYHRSISGVLIPPHPFQPDWGGFHWDRFSAIRFGRSVQNPRFHTVTADQVTNTILAVEQIRAQGYVRVGLVVGVTATRVHFFEAGFLHSQREIPTLDRLPVFTVTREAGIQKAFENWLKQHRPDAILTAALETPQMLKTAGYRVPDDIGLAATSLLDIDADAGIDQQPEEIGRVGLQMLTALIRSNDQGEPPIFRETLIEGSWVEGSTLPRR